MTACRPVPGPAGHPGVTPGREWAAKGLARLNPSHERSLVPPRGVACDVAAHACVCVPYEAVAGLRRQPGPVFGAPLLPAFLKHADEQTVVGLTAVYQAIHDHG